MSNFRKILIDFLDFKGISQVEAGELMGTSQQAISKFFSNKAEPRPTTKAKIFKSFPGFEDYYNFNTTKQPPLKKEVVNNSVNEDLIKELKASNEQIKGMLEFVNKGVVLLSYNLENHRNYCEEHLKKISSKLNQGI